MLTAKSTGAAISTWGERVTPSSYSTSTAIECSNVDVNIDSATTIATTHTSTSVCDTVSGYVIGYAYNIADIHGWLFWIGSTADSTTIIDYLYVEDDGSYIECIDALLKAAETNTKISTTGARINPSSYSSETAVECTNVGTVVSAVMMAKKATTIIKK